MVRAVPRADFLVLLVRTLALSASIKDNFADISSSDYYYAAVGVAKALGIATGVGNNRFNPKAHITRQDMMVLAQRALSRAGNARGNRGAACRTWTRRWLLRRWTSRPGNW